MEILMKFRNLSDYEKRLWLEKENSVLKGILVKKNMEIGVLKSERDEQSYFRDKHKQTIRRLKFDLNVLMTEFRKMPEKKVL